MNYCIIVQTFDQIKFEFFHFIYLPKKPINVKVLVIPLFSLIGLRPLQTFLLLHRGDRL